MREFDITTLDETPVTASDFGRLRDLLTGVGVEPDDIVRISNAMGSFTGVDLHTFAQLIFNAGVRAATDCARHAAQSVPCNLNPMCTEEIGHQGECDDEEPF